jgi:rfaE bifunctional protein nucleotidyltransferase chain/domain
VIGAEPKILELDALAAVIAARKAAGERVVHCHGVFDLVHPGHIRHLRSARAEGDLLAVTITPDRLVNKGPGRPVFNEHLRAESLAALADVDYVAINRWPTAVDTIRLLQPDVYVKGGEYEAREDDVTGMIFEEERAVTEAGGRIHFTHDVTFSSSALLNAHFSVYSPDAEGFLADFRKRHSSEDIIDVLRSFSALKVAVVGDAIIDEYHYCRAYGMASKSASVAAQVLHEESHAGGAMAVANHLAGFCGSVELITCLGALDSREAEIRAALKPNVSPTFLVRDDAPTTVKRRYVSSFLTTKLFEIARFNDDPLPSPVDRLLCAELAARLPDVDLVVVCDFGQGMLGPNAIDVIANASPFLALNAQTNAINTGFNPVTRYPRADYVCIDQEEARLAVGDRKAAVSEAVADLSERLSTRLFTVTRGSAGCLVQGHGGSSADVPVLSHDVVDTIGAGDAFLAMTSPLAHRGCDPEVIGFVGNAMGALAVQVVGNQRSVEPASLYKFVTALLQ